MKNKFRFKSLILALLMAVTPVLGVTSQNPFVVNVSAEGSDSLKDNDSENIEVTESAEDKTEIEKDAKDNQQETYELFLRNHQNFIEELTAMLWDGMFGGYSFGMMVWIWNAFMFKNLVLGPHGIAFFVLAGVVTRGMPGAIKVSRIVADQIKLLMKSFA